MSLPRTINFFRFWIAHFYIYLSILPSKTRLHFTQRYLIMQRNLQNLKLIEWAFQEQFIFLFLDRPLLYILKYLLKTHLAFVISHNSAPQFCTTILLLVMKFCAVFLCHVSVPQFCSAINFVPHYWNFHFDKQIPLIYCHLKLPSPVTSTRTSVRLLCRRATKSLCKSPILKGCIHSLL